MTATAADTTATVTWTVPLDGGLPLTGYDVRAADAVTDIQVGALLPAVAGATRLEVTGLINGTALKFQVRASNALGTGAFSALSNPVTPTPLVAAVTRLSDFNRDGRTDLVAPDNAGTLWLYPGNNAGTVGARRQIGVGFQGYTIS